MRATRVVWRAVGCPTPHEWDGTPIPARKGIPAGARCAMCGEVDRVEYTRDDGFSTNAYPPTQLSEMFPHGGPWMCAACVYGCRAHAFKCAGFFAREDGVWFFSRREILAHLLAPPEPPFVAAIPLYGIEHGGESNAWRAIWPGVPRVEDLFPGATWGEKPLTTLVRLQAKHVLSNAEVSHSRARYRVQIDEDSIPVDVALWTALRDLVETLMGELVGGVGIVSARQYLVSLATPPRPLVLVRAWRERTAPLARHHGAPWWPTFVDLCQPREPAAAAAPVAPPAPVTPKEPPSCPPKPQAQLSLF